MVYACVSDNTEEKYIFLEFGNNVFKSVESNIDSKASQMFRFVYEIFYEIFQ